MDQGIKEMSAKICVASLSDTTEGSSPGLLDLPPELRERIFIYVVRSDQPFILLNFSFGPNDIPSQHSYGHPKFPSNLLLSCSQLYQEVRPLYFKHNCFSIYVRRRAGNEEWEYFLSPEFQDYRREIKSLQITLFRWGPKDFFKDALVPAVEDCILNGRLRNLEIRVNQKWIEDGRQAIRRSQNVYLLRKLLKDPYLEKGVLLAGDLVGWECWDSDSFVEMMKMKDVTSRLDELYPREAQEPMYVIKVPGTYGYIS